MERIEECLSLLGLHLEPIEVIAQYLSVKDIGACCATSRLMRELFSSDAIWRSRCTKDLGEYLIKTPCKVEPGFINPEPKNSTLSPVSKWRLLFMYENHLWNNWRQGLYMEEDIKNYFNSPVGYIFANNDCAIYITQNSFGQINGREPRTYRLDLLNVREHSTVNAIDPMHFELDFPPQVKSVNDLIIVKYKTLVQVYQPNFLTKHCPLKHAFFFEDGQKVPLKTSEELKLLLVKMKSNPVSKMYAVVGKYFVGIEDGQSIMHIWDINSGVKLKQQVCPLKSIRIRSISASSNTLNLVLTVQEGEDLVVVLAYSLFKLDYLSFREIVQHTFHCNVNNDLVAIWNVSLSCLNVYNYESSDLLMKDEPANSRAKAFRNGFIFLHDGKLKMFNPITKVLDIVEFGGVNLFDIFSSRFLKVEINDVVELWEVGNTVKDIRRIDLDLDFDTCSLYLNNATTRCFNTVYNSVVHFW